MTLQYEQVRIARAGLGIAQRIKMAGSCGRVLVWAHGHRIFRISALETAQEPGGVFLLSVGFL